jgi:3-hydroxymyristoyl/3-hydroxydecanoyl-(acyl carrier protein) dehydratase
MQFKEINILDLLPQQPPFIMVEKLLFCDNITTKTSLAIKSDNIFVENGAFSQSGIVENVAHTCDARMGYLTINQPVKIGMIGSINNFEFSGILPKVGEEIFTEINVATEIGNIVLVKATVLCGEKLIVGGEMKIVLTDKQI